MKKYKVLKDFVDKIGVIHPEGDVISFGEEGDSMIVGLVSHGFLEEIERCKFWSRGHDLMQHLRADNEELIYMVTSQGDVLPNRSPQLGTGSGLDRRIAMGNMFPSLEEAKSYAEHLRVENELINIGVRDYGAVTKCSKESAAAGVWSVGRAHGYGHWTYGWRAVQSLFFPSSDRRDEFEIANKELLDKYFAYFGEAYVEDK